ncbi:unnamed protein product [Linum trigynum]|uniref:Uncharacterized protein n=1 Tax=Linum trigynum TaxID=586398 RepID=A0AAV2GJM7_9ROSI
MITSRPQQIAAHLRGDFAGASVVGRDEIGGWWLMRNSAGEIFCCFNPLLEPPNVIELPRNKKKKRSRPTKARTRAAFSALRRIPI